MIGFMSPHENQDLFHVRPLDQEDEDLEYPKANHHAFVTYNVETRFPPSCWLDMRAYVAFAIVRNGRGLSEEIGESGSNSNNGE